MVDHVFWKKGDPGLPDVLTDRNGDITLGMCKVCGQAEADLADSCPIIPVHRWPEGAVALVWDQHGRGKALVRDEPQKSWFLVYVSTPMPAGWDWRVPVMRNQQAPAIDLEQLRKTAADAMSLIAHVSWAWNGTGQHPNTICTELQSLLALINGQPSKSETGCSECNRLGDQPCPSCQAEIDAEGSDD